MQHQSTISYVIVATLETANPREKTQVARNIVAAWRANH